ncbi:hypothetical protein MNBD_CHLOROFLEXI01-5214, partial [hydrothermal vent metagenome]
MNTMTRYGRYPALLILSLILIITVTNLQAAVIRNSDGSVAALNAVTDGLWSDPLSWGGAVPSDGEVVEIPAGITIMLDT